MGPIDFEDDGASFRIRRQRQLDAMYRLERVVVIDQPTRQEKPETPRLLIWVLRIVGLSVFAFLAVLVLCFLVAGGESVGLIPR